MTVHFKGGSGKNRGQSVVKKDYLLTGHSKHHFAAQLKKAMKERSNSADKLRQF